MFTHHFEQSLNLLFRYPMVLELYKPILFEALDQTLSKMKPFDDSALGIFCIVKDGDCVHLEDFEPKLEFQVIVSRRDWNGSEPNCSGALTTSEVTVLIPLPRAK